MALTISYMLRELQEALKLDDKAMADYFNISVSGLKEARAGNEGDELPLHARADILDTFGFVKLSDFGMMFITKKQREKLEAARANRALTIAQNKALKALQKRLQDEHQKD